MTDREEIILKSAFPSLTSLGERVAAVSEALLMQAYPKPSTFVRPARDAPLLMEACYTIFLLKEKIRELEEAGE
jgi:hypothetical protein